MKKQSIIPVICAVLTLANYILLDRQTGYAQKVDKLRQEVNQLSRQVHQVQTEIEELKVQQRFINAINADLSNRLANAQGWK